MQTKFYNLSMLFQRCDDVPGEWSVHILDFDVLSQGNSLQHALSMAIEAALVVVEAETEMGLDPRSHRAPDESWQQWRDIVSGAGEPAKSFRINDNDIAAVAAIVHTLFVVSDAPVGPARKPTLAHNPKAKAKAKNPLLWRSAA